MAVTQYRQKDETQKARAKIKAGSKHSQCALEYSLELIALCSYCTSLTVQDGEGHWGNGYWNKMTVTVRGSASEHCFYCSP